MNDEITVPRAALEIVLRAASSYTDEGPSDEGWQSPELQAAIKVIEEALK
jgi:hypothetical protein